MLRLFILSFVVSLVVAYFILRAEAIHRHLSGDTAIPGSHKIHDESVPRIGGIAILVGWLTGLAIACHDGYLSARGALSWIVCLAPVFLAGLAEDCTKRVSARARLLWSMVSAAMAYALLRVAAQRIDVPGIDPLFAVPAVSFVFTLLAVGGLAHAVNIIDGLHGLALSVCFMALLAIGYVAAQVSDAEVLVLAGVGAGAVLGLRAWNFPSGRIFCGDGGAYFLGAYIAILSGLLVGRNEDVSAWFPVLALLYPVWETLFSAYRRKVMLKVPMSAPDKLHMHTLVFERLASAAAGEGGIRARRNSDASHTMVLFTLVNIVPAVLWWRSTPYLIASALGFVVVYLLMYRALLKQTSSAADAGSAIMPAETTPQRSVN